MPVFLSRCARILTALTVLLPCIAVAQEQVETLTVQAPTPSATGVTGTAPGGGLIMEEKAPKSRSTVSTDFIAKQSPAANAFDLLRLSPGANTASSDAYGLSPGVNISVRGLNGDEIAYLLEGAPLNDIGYYAGYPSQWVDSENLHTVALSQGTADLDTPTINATGGLIDLQLRDPASQPGGFASFSYGSYHATREFLRVDTGSLLGTGWRGFVSFSDTQADNDRGPGHDHRQHVDFKFTRDWSDGTRVAIVGSYHDAILSSYPNPTLADWKTYGRSYNYDATFSPQDPNYWKLYQQPWRDVQVSAPVHIPLGAGLAFDTIPYFEHGYGNAPYGEVLPETGLFQGTQPISGVLPLPHAVDGAALVMGDYIGNQYRAGQVSKLSLTAGNQIFTAGWWYDYADDDDTEPFTPVSLSGEPASVWGSPFFIRLGNGQQLSVLDAHTREQVNALFVKDAISLDGGRLTIEAGLKYAMVNRSGTNSLPGPQYRVGLNSAQPLPRASIRYQLTPTQSIFANVSTNFRSPVEYILYNQYDLFSGSELTQGRTIKDEYSISEEFGWRYQGALLDAALTFFNYNFTNRQVPTLTGPALISTTINAGGQTSRGFDAELGLRPVRHWRPYLSADYLNATTDNNFQIGTVTLPTSGKEAVRSPRWQAAMALDYDDSRFFGNAALKYVGSQYSTFVNDEKMPSFTQLDATLGMRFPDLGFLHRPEARLNFINLADAKFLSGVASVSPNAQTIVINGTRVDGSTPTYYIGPGFAALLTLASAF